MSESSKISKWRPVLQLRDLMSEPLGMSTNTRDSPSWCLPRTGCGAVLCSWAPSVKQLSAKWRLDSTHISLSQVARISSAETREITPLFPVAARISNKNFTRLLTRELLLPWFWAMGILMAAEAPTTTKLQPSADGWHGLWSHELHPIPDERVVIYKELPNFCRVTSVKELAAGMSYHCIHTATPTAWLEMTKLTKPPTRWHTQCPAAFFRAANLKHHRPRSSGASTKSCGPKASPLWSAFLVLKGISVSVAQLAIEILTWQILIILSCPVQCKCSTFGAGPESMCFSW